MAVIQDASNHPDSNPSPATKLGQDTSQKEEWSSAGISSVVESSVLLSQMVAYTLGVRHDVDRKFKICDNTLCKW